MIAAGPSTYFHDPRVAALARAGADGDAGLVRELVTEGASPNARGDGGVTPLLWALGQNNVEGVRALLAAGGDPTLADHDGVNALSLATAADNPDLLKAMLDTGRVDVNARVDGDQTMLMLAAKYGLLPQTRLLLKAGADPNITDQVRATALQFADNSYEVALLLLEAGVDPRRPAGTGLCYSQTFAMDAKRLDIMPAEMRVGYEKVFAWLQAHNAIVPAPSPPRTR